MKPLLRPALLLLLAHAWPGAAQGQESKCYAKASAADVAHLVFLKGPWLGQVVEKGASRTLRVRFFEQGGQVLAAIEEQGRLVPLAAQASLCAPGRFHFFGTTPAGERFTLTARLQGRELAGTFAVGATCGVADKPAFALHRPEAVE